MKTYAPVSTNVLGLAKFKPMQTDTQWLGSLHWPGGNQLLGFVKLDGSFVPWTDADTDSIPDKDTAGVNAHSFE